MPNKTERKDIIKIHLKKRHKWNDKIDLDTLAEETDGFNGADLEGIVKDAVEDAFLNNKDTIETASLMEAKKHAKSISNIQGYKIEPLRDKLKEYNIRPASE